jgi:predicted Zn-dependent peptidase
MSRLGKAELVYGELMTVDELLAAVSSVTLDDVQDVAFELLRGPLSLAAIGPYDDDRALAAAVA